MVLDCLRSAHEPAVIANLLHVFSARALPQFEPCVIALCQNGDAAVRRGAFHVLKQNSHPAIREFALAELAKGEVNGSVVGLFSANYQAGDEQRLLETIERSSLPKRDCISLASDEYHRRSRGQSGRRLPSAEHHRLCLDTVRALSISRGPVAA